MPDFCETPDFLSSSSLLRRASVNRQIFAPTNPAHTESLAKFIATGNWGDTQFFCEAPFSDVPMTVLMKYAGHLLNVHRETVEDRLARIHEAASN